MNSTDEKDTNKADLVGTLMKVQRFPESDIDPSIKAFELPKDGKTWTAYSNGDPGVVKWVGDKLYGLWTLNRQDVCNAIVPVSYYEAERVITQPTYTGYCPSGTQAIIVSMTVGSA